MVRVSSRRSLRSHLAATSRQLIVPASLACVLVFVAQARAGKISPVLDRDDFERGGQFFTVQLVERDDDNRQTATIQHGHVADREAYSRRLTFTMDNHHSNGSPTTTSILGAGTVGLGVQDTKPSDPVSTVPEPSSLLLMSAGLLGIGTLLRNRLAAKPN